MFIDLIVRSGLWLAACLFIAIVAAAIAALVPQRLAMAVYTVAGIACWIALFLIP